NTPAQLLQSQFAPNMSVYVWVVVILIYYMLATLLPIDKVIGKIYPIFGFLLIGMAVAIVAAFVIYRPAIPEIWEGMQNLNPKAADNPIFPMMFISIACGAVSGFHATQSTLVARCMVNESQGRRIFYGAMIVEGIVALIWAAAASYFYHDNPALLSESGPAMVGIIANRWFPKAIAVVTILGVISAAITSGDTALRSCRLIVADFMNIEQKSLSKRLWVAVPIFAVTAVFLVLSLAAPKGFAVVWQYFSWANQFLSAITLWAVTVYIARNKTGMYYLISLIPALFMTMATTSFLLVSKTSLGSFMPRTAGYVIAAVFTAVTLAIFLRKEIVKKA
ncbi:MAG: carbon starvation CstA family protein, partial [Bacteroidales bacterium]|nr:carbon starvation CstA family protein [Bacteroidales bacterium]